MNHIAAPAVEGGCGAGKRGEGGKARQWRRKKRKKEEEEEGDGHRSLLLPGLLDGRRGSVPNLGGEGGGGA
uniref:Uncharacterized protein n=1 Tax=Oryza punctata TaxID=4537 RepID=A0A0E0LHV5_ORYPU